MAKKSSNTAKALSDFPQGLILLSGGFDSAVAAKLALKQKTGLFAVHFSMEKFVGKQSIEKTRKVSQLLGIKKLFIIDVSDILKEFVENCNNHYYFIFMKRVFFRLAEKIASENKLDFLVTGENLGQVSSQTLSNISTIAKAASFPVVRPLLGMEKDEIISLAKKFGSHDIAVGPEMCDFLGPKKPATVSTVKKLEIEEQKIELEKLLQEAIEKTRIISF